MEARKVLYMSATRRKVEKPFSLKLFVMTVFGFLFVYYFVANSILKTYFPAVWLGQVSASWGVNLCTFLGMCVVNGLFEFKFHRYVLHARLIPFLGRFYKQHTRHHALTHVIVRKITVGGAEGGMFVVENRFPIVDDEQHEASFFPWYSFPAFALLASILFTLVVWRFPWIPLFNQGSLAIACSLFLYEVLHAIQHWAPERWIPLLYHPTFGRAWRVVYSYHLGHHANIRCNESISGVLGFPLWDVIFGTLRLTPSLFKNGERATEAEIRYRIPPRPRFIGWLDMLAERRIAVRHDRGPA